MFDYLQFELMRFGIKTIRQPDEETYFSLLQNADYKIEIDSFYAMLQNFLLLHKNSAHDIP